MRALALDFETANESRASPCAVGLAVVNSGHVTASTSFLIRPKLMTFGFHQTRIHGIGPNDVASAPEFPEIYKHLSRLLEDNLIICHNANFDIDVLHETCREYNIIGTRFEVLCTLELSRALWPDKTRHTLKDISKYLGFPFQHHNAKEDAILAAQIAIHAAKIAGTDDIRAAARNLGVSTTFADPSLAYEARFTIKSPSGGGQDISRRAQLSEPLEFEVVGSTGCIYKLISGYKDRNFDVRCECPAGQNRRQCHHVKRLASGDTSKVISSNRDQVSEFALRCERAGGLDAIFSRQ